MPKQKYQRPEVYATGKRERLWRGEWRSYFLDAAGKQQSKHKSKTWSRNTHTKAQAQAELDEIIRQEREGGPKRDGSMTLSTFWTEIYEPIRSKRWGVHTKYQAQYVWTNFIKPALGNSKLSEITKASIELLLVKMADQDRGKAVLDATRIRLHSLFEEALDNDYVPKNPARKVQMPGCRGDEPTRPLTASEVQTLWDKSEGRDYIFWRTLLMTGTRINELLALDRADLLPEGMRIDESALNGRPSSTKNKKPRLAPIPLSLRTELEEWLATHPYQLIFPAPDGRILRYDSAELKGILAKGRAVVPDLDFRMCRTTFATLFEGDLADIQASLGHHAASFTLRHYRKTITERHQAAVENLDRKLKLVPKTGAA